MKIPSNYTETEVIEIIDNISKKFAKKFKFAYHSENDMRQQIFLFAIDGIANYDGVRPLENFLTVHVKNRLINFKRDNYQRPGKPCIKCPYYDKACKVSSNQCTMFQDTSECELYQGWIDRNLTKKNIISPIDITIINDENERNTKALYDLESQISGEELLEKIDLELPVSLREDYIKMRAGTKLPKVRKERVQDAVLEIIDRYN